MRKFIILAFIYIFNLNNLALSNEPNCDEFKKFSIDYMKCKTNLIKNKTISKSENFVKDTKGFQKKAWSEEKNKINKIKKKYQNNEF